MKKTLPYGLGWQPDLPDLRDKTFHRARLKLKHAQHSSKDESKRPRSPEPRHTFDGWQASEGEVEKRLSRLDNDRKTSQSLRERLEQFKANGFADGRHGRKTLLLAEPPADPLEWVDLRDFMSPVENQLHVGSCTAQAIMGLVEYLQIGTRGEYIDGSRLFLYKVTRNLMQMTGDTGAYIRETIKALRLFGNCPEFQWTYDPLRFDEEPPAFCYAFASNYKALRYYRLGHLGEIKRSLSQGYPVAFGFTCFESLFTRDVKETGIIPYPNRTERARGGHAVLAVGYRDKGGAPVQECPEEHVIIRNSWGDWGKDGYGFLPYAYFLPEEQLKEDIDQGVLPLADDFWTMTQMEFPDIELAAAAPFTLSGPCHNCNAVPTTLKGPVHGG